jgi:hypothetical protein
MWLSVGFWNWSLLRPKWVAAMRPAPDQIVDHYQDWGSARNYWDGLPVYTPHSMSIPRHLGLLSNPVKSIEYNAHPPTSVLLALPLARLDYPDAVLAWNAISLAAFLGSLTIVATVLPVSRTLFSPALALLTFCHPLYGNLCQGQLTLILGFLVTMMWALERSGRSSAAGLLLGTATAIKLFPGFLAVYYVARGRLRPLLAVMASFFSLTLATVVVLGLDTYRDYVQNALPRLSAFRGFGYNFSIAGLWHKLFDPAAEVVLAPPLWPSLTLARWGTLLSDVVVTLIVAAFAYRARTLAQRDLAFASAVAAMLLVSPLTWDISLLLLLVPTAVIARSADQLRWIPSTLALILLVIWLPQPALTFLATVGGTVKVTTPAFILGAASLKFYALLGTFVLVLAAFQAESRRNMVDGGIV